MRQIILICGFPKSGNTWLSRLLGEIYNSPVQGLPGQEQGSLATEGQDRPGNHCIIQAHLPPANYYDKFTQEEIDNKRTLLIIRNPLDVAVSASFFWRISLEDTVQKMIDGHWPFIGFPSWVDYYNDLIPFDDMTSYEALSQRPVEELNRLTGEGPVVFALRRQAFYRKRFEIDNNPGRYSYDKKAQLHNLRRGVVGDWRNYFSDELLKIAIDNFGKIMERFGYERY